MFAAVVVGVIVFPAAILIQAAAIDLTVRLAAIALARGYAGRSFWHNVAVMMGVMLILLVALLAQVAVWAVVFVLCNALPDFGTAYYHSAVNFTSLGYGDIVMTPQWRLLGPLEAANGVLMFGVSAAAMAAVTSRLVELRLKGGQGGT